MGTAEQFQQISKGLASEVGFDICGVAAVRDEQFPELSYFPEWIEKGHAGEMEYLKSRNQDGELKRAALKNIAPWAKSVVVCAVNYNADAPKSIESADGDRAWISRYAWFAQPESGKGADYHDAVLRRLREMESKLHTAWEIEHPEQKMESRCYVDTGPIVERVYAKYAGIGWIGKNTCIINQEIGSWIFLGVILTNVDLAGEEQLLPTLAADRCGSCTRCIEACPTQAITPYKLDASRCIAYLTIEKRGAIPENLREPMGRHVFGCDICQDVCPWNSKGQGGTTNGMRRAPVSKAPEFQARPELVNPALEWLAAMSREVFNRVFKDSPVKRAKYEGMQRNVAVAMGNSRDQRFREQLQALSQDGDENLAEHAKWALIQLDR